MLLQLCLNVFDADNNNVLGSIFQNHTVQGSTHSYSRRQFERDLAQAPTVNTLIVCTASGSRV